MTISPGRLLFVDVKLPTPDRDAASQRSLQMISQFVRWGFTVEFGAVFPVADVGAQALAGLGVEVVPCVDEPSLRRHLAAHPGRYDVAVLCWTRVASRLIEPVRAANPGAFLVFDTVDVNHVREYRHARTSGNAAILRRALETKRRELTSVVAADCTLAVSEADAQTLVRACPTARVELVTLRSPDVAAREPDPASSARGLLFLGNMQATANVDAVEHLVGDILPELRRAGGDARLTLAGADPPSSVLGLANEPGVSVIGHVDDLKSLFASHLVFACPLRFGSGIKGKLLTAMARGLPAVVSPIAAEGMAISDGCEVLIAETPTEWAEAIMRLQGDADLRRRLASLARKYVLEHHSEARVSEQMRRVFWRR